MVWVLLWLSVSTIVLCASRTVVEPPAQFSKTLSVLDFGAVGDGKTLDTKAFQSTILAAHQLAAASKSDVIVSVPKNSKTSNYLIGGISLLSGVFLRVELGVTILGSGDINDYPYSPDEWVLIGATNQTRVGILGPGTIDGQAPKYFFGSFNPQEQKIQPITWEGQHGCTGECRPRLVQFVFCSFVLVTEIHLTNSGDWTSHYLGCANVHVHDIKVTGNFDFPNNDGIDPDSSINVTIENCEVLTGDDGICLKSTKGYGILKNVVVRNITVQSKSSAVKIGSATQELISDVLVENIEILPSHRGICIQLRDSGNVSSITYRNIRASTRFFPLAWWGNGEGIEFSILPRNGSEALGVISSIRVENFYGRSEGGITLTGLFAPRYSLHSIYFVDVHLVLSRFGNSTPTSGIDYNPVPPSIPSFVSAPTDGIRVEGVSELRIEKSTIEFDWKNRQSYWGSCRSSKESKQIDWSGLTCS